MIAFYKKGNFYLKNIMILKLKEENLSIKFGKKWNNILKIPTNLKKVI